MDENKQGQTDKITQTSEAPKDKDFKGPGIEGKK